MDFGLLIESLDHVPQQRPSADCGKPLRVLAITRDVAGRDRHLHKPGVALGKHVGENFTGLVMHHVGYHRRAVVIRLHRQRTLGRLSLGRPAAATRVQCLLEQPRELGVLRVGRHLAGLGVLEAEHADQHRREGNVGQDVDRLGRAIDAIEILGKAGPVPWHPLLHRRERDRLDARHAQHRALPHLGCDGREAEAAIADDYRGNAVPARECAIGVPEKLRVVMGMQVDESGRDMKSLGVDDPSGIGRWDMTDGGDYAVTDGDVAAIAWRA